jgi:hypothetical protein
MQEHQPTRIHQEIADIEKLIAQKRQMLSSTRNREDRELIEVQINDLQTHRRQLASLLAPGRGEAEENAGHTHL